MKILGIFRGFPGLGRVVAGVSLLETIKMNYNCEIKIISYLQGNKYLEKKGCSELQEATPLDYCSIGLLPTNKMGKYIHNVIRQFCPDMVLLDGEPLLLQSLRISYPSMKLAVLLNPADVDNPDNDKEAMDFFNALYSLSDLAIVHGLRSIANKYQYKKIISVGTILRPEIFKITNNPSKDIFCILGGGTINVGHQFASSTIRIAELCQKAASYLPNHTMHIVCSSQNIFDAINENFSSENVVIHNQVLPAEEFYSNASLIITRSGRNTLSELVYLGIPAISFITGDMYRRAEQEQNFINLNATNVRSLSLNTSIDDFVSLIESLIKTGRCKNSFESGNAEAIRQIISLLSHED
jgi:hypothetical protein